jgi:transcription antitermination factor NusA-like protein
MSEKSKTFGDVTEVPMALKKINHNVSIHSNNGNNGDNGNHLGNKGKKVKSVTKEIRFTEPFT